MAKELTPTDLKVRLDAGEDIALIDVREEWEVNLGMIPGAVHIAMNDIPDTLDQVPNDKPVVFVCHTGRRSLAVTEWVAAQGYDNVLNLTGGVLRWMIDVDPDFPGRY